jgi:hypothetical protein
MPADQRWTIKPELLVSPLNGAEISMGIAYGPAVDEPVEVVPAALLAELEAARDEKRYAAEMQVAIMREGAARLKPLARRAITEPGASGDEARRELGEAISWLAKGAPTMEVRDAGLSSASGRARSSTS